MLVRAGVSRSDLRAEHTSCYARVQDSGQLRYTQVCVRRRNIRKVIYLFQSFNKTDFTGHTIVTKQLLQKLKHTTATLEIPAQKTYFGF